MKPCQVDWQKLVMHEKIYSVKENQVASLKINRMRSLHAFRQTLTEIYSIIKGNWKTLCIIRFNAYKTQNCVSISCTKSPILKELFYTLISNLFKTNKM